MGKDGTQLLRHCVRLLVLVSTDLLAVRLSGIVSHFWSCSFYFNGGMAFGEKHIHTQRCLFFASLCIWTVKA